MPGVLRAGAVAWLRKSPGALCPGLFSICEEG